MVPKIDLPLTHDVLPSTEGGQCSAAVNLACDVRHMAVFCVSIRCPSLEYVYPSAQLKLYERSAGRTNSIYYKNIGDRDDPRDNPELLCVGFLFQCRCQQGFDYRKCCSIRTGVVFLMHLLVQCSAD